jgi:hypothetical protein
MQIFYEIIITVFQFAQRAIENHAACHACRRLPTSDLDASQDAVCAIELDLSTTNLGRKVTKQ